MKKVLKGDRVVVYDRYRFAIPVKGVVTSMASSNDGVELVLTSTNNGQYPTGTIIWVSRRQLRRDKS